MLRLVIITINDYYQRYPMGIGAAYQTLETKKFLNTIFNICIFVLIYIKNFIRDRIH